VGDFALLRCDLAGREPLLGLNAIANPKPSIHCNGHWQCDFRYRLGNRTALGGNSCNVICRPSSIINSRNGNSCDVVKSGLRETRGFVRAPYGLFEYSGSRFTQDVRGSDNVNLQLSLSSGVENECRTPTFCFGSIGVTKHLLRRFNGPLARSLRVAVGVSKLAAATFGLDDVDQVI
jgi:hypothetical protein